ncbi:DUF5131 family protein [Phyllobacterium lublinensis]|uniref:DUF5131 family protein n=1 Tax=Phyllobacterium lublinensis TaxID=2875708 RepID=UPI001CC967D6|nr:phage Gp37/Gp68 family protein [Phyllobacterium sp. 2063]
MARNAEAPRCQRRGLYQLAREVRTRSPCGPIGGCTKVSPGCDHCYAETLMDTRYGKVPSTG